MCLNGMTARLKQFLQLEHLDRWPLFLQRRRVLHLDILSCMNHIFTVGLVGRGSEALSHVIIIAFETNIMPAGIFDR